MKYLRPYIRVSVKLARNFTQTVAKQVSLPLGQQFISTPLHKSPPICSKPKNVIINRLRNAFGPQHTH